jgi:MFS family permease
MFYVWKSLLWIELPPLMHRARILKTGIPAKKFALVLFLVFNSLVWHTLAYAKLSAYVHDDLLILGGYYAGFAFAAILGASLFRRSRETGLILWALLGAAMTALLALMASNGSPINILISALFGASSGVGFPSCLAYFADATDTENRGTYGGITWSTVGFGILGLYLLTSSLNTVQTFQVLALWRFLGFVGFFFLFRNQGKVALPVDVPSYQAILGRKDMVLYLLPWIMFSLVNFAEAPIVTHLPSYPDLAGFAEFAITGLFAIVGGMLADIVGRKRVIIAGFALLGVEYAVFGLFSTTPAIWYVYTTFDGVAWGMFAAVFFMTVWGDLAGNVQKERYYLLGGLPYLLAVFLSEVVTPFLGVIQAVAAFSLASFFLFLAVLPLMYAPETLPEKKMRERELKGYLEKAKKVKEKYV